MTCESLGYLVIGHISFFSTYMDISQVVLLVTVPTPLVLSWGKVLSWIWKGQDASFLPKGSGAVVTKVVGKQTSGNFSCSFQAEDMWRLKTDSLNTIKYSHTPWTIFMHI